MNLRTITFWSLYDPKRKLLIESRQFKYQLKPMAGCVVVKMRATTFQLPLSAQERRANERRSETDAQGL